MKHWTQEKLWLMERIQFHCSLCENPKKNKGARREVSHVCLIQLSARGARLVCCVCCSGLG